METKLEPKDTSKEDYRKILDRTLLEELQTSVYVHEVSEFISFLQSETESIAKGTDSTKDVSEEFVTSLETQFDKVQDEIKCMFKLSYAFASLLATDALEFCSQYHNGTAEIPDVEKEKYLKKCHSFMTLVASLIARQFSAQEQVYRKVIGIIEDRKLTVESPLLEFEQCVSDWFIDVSIEAFENGKENFFDKEMRDFNKYYMSVIKLKLGQTVFSELKEKFKRVESAQ